MAIRHKRKNSTGYTWLDTDLVDGQIGINTADGTLHVKKTDDSVVTIPNDSALAGKADEANPSLSGTITLGDNTLIRGNFGTAVSSPYFQSNSGNDTLVRLKANNKTATSVSALMLNGSNDISNTVQVLLRARGDDTATATSGIVWQKLTGGAVGNPPDFAFVSHTGTGYSQVASISSTGVITNDDHLVTKKYVDDAVVAAGGLPSQTGNSGKYLTTDGTTASWATVSGGGASFPVGAIVESPTAPSDGGTWLACDGTAKSQSTYSGLYSAIGQRYMQASITAGTSVFASASTAVYTIVKAGSNYIALGNTNQPRKSTDLTTWSNTTGTLPTTLSAQHLSVTDGTNIVVWRQTTAAFRSADGGDTWSSLTLPSATLCAMNYGNGYFVAAANSSSNLYHSTDGSSWTTVTGGFPNSASVNNTSLYYTGAGWIFTTAADAYYTTASPPTSGWTQLVGASRNFITRNQAIKSSTETIPAAPYGVMPVYDPSDASTTETLIAPGVGGGVVTNVGLNDTVFYDGQYFVAVVPNTFSGATTINYYTENGPNNGWSSGFISTDIFYAPYGPRPESFSYNGNVFPMLKGCVDTTSGDFLLLEYSTGSMNKPYKVSRKANISTEFCVPNKTGAWIKAA